MIQRHFENNNVFTFVTRDTDKAYTIVKRNERDEIIDILETKEENLPIKNGERDIGLFIFKKDIIFKFLKLELTKKYSLTSKEHGFLYIINHLVKNQFKVEGLKIAHKKELISLNKISDLNY